MTGREKVKASLAHEDGPLAVDFGSTFITGVHCSCVEQLREHYGLEQRPVKIAEPYQMLGLIEDDLREAMGIDTSGIFPYKTIFGFVNEDWKPFKTWWGQEVLVSKHFNVRQDDSGTYIYPQGDMEAPASGHMPTTGYFFDSIIRQEPLDEDHLDPADNLEEFGVMGEAEQAYWRSQILQYRGSSHAVLTHLNGTSLGDIALIPAPFLKHPKGIRDVAEWYMATAANQEYVAEVFDRQAEIAIANMQTLHAIAGDVIDVVVVCGTDFGTQSGSFCSPDTFDALWLPRYQKINGWIHANTSWKTFKHSCGAVEPFMEHFIKAGFDIINPVQFGATGMDPKFLKAKYGDRLTFWGGGVNTQTTLPFGKPEEVREEVLRMCEVFAPGGGFVFNTVHNMQAGTPVANMVAMMEALATVRG